MHYFVQWKFLEKDTSEYYKKKISLYVYQYIIDYHIYLISICLLSPFFKNILAISYISIVKFVEQLTSEKKNKIAN